MHLTDVAKVIIKKVRSCFLCHLWENVSNSNVKIFSTESRYRRLRSGRALSVFLPYRVAKKTHNMTLLGLNFCKIRCTVTHPSNNSVS